MITGLKANPTAAEFKLPEVTSRETPTIAGFSTVYQANSNQFATKEEADALAGLLGGTVTDLSEQWSMLRVSPLYQVELPNGVSLNAGLLADRFRRYGTETALEITEAEVGMLTRPLASNTSSSADTPAIAASSVPFLAANAATVAPRAYAESALQTPAQRVSEPADSTAKDAKLASAARQFEALMIGTILKSATPEDGGGILSGQGDSAGQSVYQMAMENLAQMLSESGGLGLADHVTTHMRSAQAKASTVA